MNVIATLEKELKDRIWTPDEIARYLYIRSGELFSYDPRYYYADDDLKREILNRKINLENVTDFRVVCTSWASQVYVPLAIELAKLPAKVVSFSGHSYAEIPNISADACRLNDLARIKMRLNTEGYIKPGDHSFNQTTLVDIDRRIQYIENYYATYKINSIAQTIRSEFMRINNIVDSHRLDQSKLYAYKIAKLKTLLATFPLVTSYDDIDFAINYLGRKLFTLDERTSITTCELYDERYEDWNFAKIYCFNLSNRYVIYYILSKKNGLYTFEQADYQGIHNLLNAYPRGGDEIVLH